MRRIPRISNKFRASKLKATSISYPGAYIEEVSRGARTIEGVATSVTAFVGRTVSGPVNEPATIKNYADFERVFGGLWEESQLGYAVRSFFQNGGREAIIVRLTNGGSTVSISLPTGAASPNDNLELLARNIGSWGRKLRVTVGHDTSDPADTSKFNLLIEDPSSGSQEKHINVSVDDSDPRFIGSFLEQRSQLVVAAKATNGNFVVPNARPNAGLVNANIDSGNDGSPLTAAGFTGPGLRANKEGLYALARINLFNLLVIPPYNSNDDVDTSVINEAALYCERRRAFYIIDPPSSWTNAATAESGIRSLGTTSSNAAVYFPRVRQSDPLQNNQIITLAPGGTLAGIYVRTDVSRGIWKAPAGIE
ncbi:MAG: phage tail sheath family protein, partial [Verrucomicrobia bacterium]|nr:phage tail sheath family protein [Verrucomicrobiota bacterium]